MQDNRNTPTRVKLILKLRSLNNKINRLAKVSRIPMNKRDHDHLFTLFREISGVVKQLDSLEAPVITPPTQVETT